MFIVDKLSSNTDVHYRSCYQAFRHKNRWNNQEAMDFCGVALYNISFVSRNQIHLLGRSDYRCEQHNLSFDEEPQSDGQADYEIPQNISFRYPLLRWSASPASFRQKRVIILLHGLNERTFAKYLPWARELCRNTGAPVVLFPLAFHMNRVLPAWSGQQAQTLLQRQRIPDNRFAHRFNTVISDRLEQRPERLFWGAIQSYLDLVDLVREIRSGQNPHFESDARIDFLGYSAGGYISFLLLLENLDGIFNESRAALFASCIPARDLNLASPLILDMAAETTLMKLFVKSIDVKPGDRMQHWLASHGEGRWLRALSGIRPDRRALERRLKELASRVLGIANINDDVTPLNAVLDTLQGLRRDTGVQVVELDLGLHENPFVDVGGDRLARRGRIEFLDEQRYGTEFRRFIETVSDHLA